MNRLTSIVLAAGTSSRMGEENKLLLPLGDSTILEHVLHTIMDQAPGDLIVVTGFDDRRIRQALVGMPVRVAYNPEYASGIASSIRRGVLAAGTEAYGLLIALGDMPNIHRSTFALLAARYREAAQPSIIAAQYQGTRGHPVIFHPSFREELLALRGDEGARSIIERHPEALIAVDVDDPGIVQDIDTPQAYNSLLSVPSSGY